MDIRDLLLLLCLIGGLAGVVTGAVRRDLATAMMGLIAVAIATFGLLG